MEEKFENILNTLFKTFSSPKTYKIVKLNESKDNCFNLAL